MDAIGVGVIGAGFIGPAHIEALRRLPRISVVALAGSDGPTARAKAELLGIARHTATTASCSRLPEVRVVHVCTPNHLHYAMAREALEAGKHVVCEKPLAMEAWQARELVELAERKGLVGAVHFNVRYYPLVRQMKSW